MYFSEGSNLLHRGSKLLHQGSKIMLACTFIYVNYKRKFIYELEIKCL
jgi:hypothetical protein